jgi:drug/metabolite transporter (DMT)-like permease
MNRSLRNRGILLTLVSTIGFSLYPILGKFVFSGGANLSTALFFRFFLSALIFWAIALTYEGIPKLKLRIWIILLLMGGIGYASMSGLYLSSVSYIPASLAALLLYTYPIIVAVLSIVTRQESFSWHKIIGVLISSFGLVFVLGLNFNTVNLTGVLLAFGASLVYSLYIIAGNYVLKEISPLLSTAVICSSASVTYAIAGLSTSFTWNLPLLTWIEILGIAVFCSILAMLTFFYGVKAIGPTSASVISTLEPILTFLFAALLFDERFTMIQGLGGILVIFGGIRAVYNSNKSVSENPSTLLS